MTQERREHTNTRRHVVPNCVVTRRQLLLASASCAYGLLQTPSAALDRPSPDVAVSPVNWDELEVQLSGRLLRVDWPFEDCSKGGHEPHCASVFRAARNPYFLGDNPALTQSFGWVGAWSTQPSLRALEAGSANDIALALRFATAHNIRVAVKGGGHSYVGGSNAANSLLIWTRRLNSIELHDNFVPDGTDLKPAPAVSIGAGAMWGEVYNKVCADGGRYVQGGGCLTVGVAGLVQSGGFGSLSRTFGLAALHLIEAEVVTADGLIRVVNEARDPELFFALKGGGGGTFGVVTRMTLRTHELPKYVGAVFAEVSAHSDEAYAKLLRRLVQFYADALHNPAWGEQLNFRPNNVLRISMLSQGLTQPEIEETWRPFWDWIEARTADYALAEPTVVVLEERQFWDPKFLKTLPGIVGVDDRPDANQDRIFWAGNREESGQFIHAYSSVWIPSSLLDPAEQHRLADSLFAGSRHWSITLHTNKGLSAAPEEVRRRVREETAINPVVTESFALAISGAEGLPAYPGIRGFEPDVELARRQASRVKKAIGELERGLSARGSYVAESDYFNTNWQADFWGAHYSRLEKTKRAYDVHGILQVHHGVGSS